MRERRLVTDFGAYSTPREFLIISISPPNTRLWEYLVSPIVTLLTVDGSILHILRIHNKSSLPFQPLVDPIIHPDEFEILQSQVEKVHVSTLVRSYISSILIALRLHPKVISTSISSRAVGDIRDLIRVLSLQSGVDGWTNAENVPRAIEFCTVFRLRMESGEVTFKKGLEEVLENVRAPF